MSHCARCQYSGDLKQHAEDAGHPLCYVCTRRSLTNHERQTCARCIGRIRTNLADIQNYANRLPDVILENLLPNTAATDRTGGSHEPAMPGGDALTMLAPGGAGFDTPSRNGNLDHVADELPGDPPSVAYRLGVHEDDWRRLQHDFAAGPADIASSITYLQQNLERMAQAHSEFDVFSQDIQLIKSRLQAVVGLSEQPVHGASCFDCGTYLVRRYRYPGDRYKPPYSRTHGPGLEDNWTCERCERVYSPAEYWLAVRAALELQQQDTA